MKISQLRLFKNKRTLEYVHRNFCLSGNTLTDFTQMTHIAITDVNLMPDVVQGNLVALVEFHEMFNFFFLNLSDLLS